MAQNTLKVLEAKRSQINARIKKIKDKAKMERRKEDTRRKVLLGGMVLDQLNAGNLGKDVIRNWIGESAINDKDKKLFNNILCG